MPKGRVEPRTVACRHCGSEFVSDKIGKASFFCRQPDCDLSRGGSVGAQERRRRAQEAQRLAREAQRERERQEAATARERARYERLAQARREREQRLAEIRAEEQRELFDVIRENDRVMLLFDELVEAAMRAPDAEADRVGLRKAITALAHAKGPEQTWQASVRLAAEAMAFAGTIPRNGVRDRTPVLT